MQVQWQLAEIAVCKMISAAGRRFVSVRSEAERILSSTDFQTP